MSHNPSNYQQNYQNYYPNINEQYDDYYEDEGQDLSYDDTQDLQVPNSRLYPEGYSDITELYARNALYAETQQRVENNSMQYRHDYDPEPNDYYYNVTQLQQHRTRVPRAQCSTLQSTSNYPYHHNHSLYTACPLATTAIYHHHDDNNSFIPETAGKSTNKTAKRMGVHSCVGTSNLQEVGDDYNVELYHEGQGKKKVYHYRKNYDDYNNADGVRYEPKKNPEVYMNYQGKKFCVYGSKVGKNAGMKKYPVTVKTPKYVSKSQVVPPLNKRPSALCLPVVTQPDPGLVKRKSKTHQEKVKKTYDQSEPLPQNPTDIPDNYSYAAHQMDSEGDMNPKSMAKGLEHLLDQYESNVVLNENQATNTNEEDGSGETKHKIKEFSKFLKPRVPSSIKAKQEKIAKIKSSLNTSGSSIQPKMKISLDKLLNRLQKCEIVESTDKLSENSYCSKKEAEVEKSKEDDSKKRSFNYDTLTRKLSPTVQDKKQKEQNKSLLNKPSTSVTTSLDNNRSSRMIALDDNCALDLHRSKSYIVDLIDRALSKELGTIPRGQPIHQEMTTKQAVKNISRHRQSRHKELCYEVTAALTDSFISNATAPQSQPRDVELKRSQSDDNEIKNKLCASFGDDVNYIKQLKQLRWGHIRHIQHEARKLADLEEFLEKCGEIEY